MSKFAILVLLGLFGSPALAQDRNDIQDNLYKEEATVVLPVFYVVRFQVEGFKIHQEASNTTRPTPKVVYAPQNANAGTYTNNVSPHILLEKLTKEIDEQLDQKP